MNQMLKDFRKECDDWLGPYGYTLHSSANQGRVLVFTSIFVLHRPSIQCYFNQYDEKKCKLISTGYKMFLHLTSGDIQFKHPNIQKYIDTMEHYAMIAEKYPPF